jgi:hypothetical protein|tara:strand:- start:209 stop:403 length:195 start_codon:yes stop_codon:yes gene_type:complete
MELPIAKLFLQFKEIISQQMAKITEMTFAHDHQLRSLRAEVDLLKIELIKKNIIENDLIDDLPF